MGGSDSAWGTGPWEVEVGEPSTMSQEAVHRCLGSQEENPQPHTKVFNRWHDVPGALQPEILRDTVCSPRLRERHPTLTQGGGLVPGPGGLRASPEHGVGGCSKGQSHAPTKVPGASMQAEPQGTADRAPAGRAAQPRARSCASAACPAGKEGVGWKDTPPTPSAMSRCPPVSSGLATLSVT